MDTPEGDDTSPQEDPSDAHKRRREAARDHQIDECASKPGGHAWQPAIVNAGQRPFLVCGRCGIGRSAIPVKDYGIGF